MHYQRVLYMCICAERQEIHTRCKQRYYSHIYVHFFSCTPAMLRYRDASCLYIKVQYYYRRCHFNDLGMYVNRRHSFWKALAVCHFFFLSFLSVVSSHPCTHHMHL